MTHHIEAPRLTIELDTDKPRQLMVNAVGESTLAFMGRVCSEVLDHGKRTGALMERMLAGCSEEVRCLGNTGGALHDIGKYGPVLALIMSGACLTPEQREWVRADHTSRGREMLNKYAAAIGSSALEVAAHMAGAHHGSLPRNYAALPPDDALRHGLTHLLQIADPLDALTDPTRTYVAAREGRPLTAREVLGIALSNPGCDHPPIIEGREIPVRSMVADMLGLSAEQ